MVNVHCGSGDFRVGIITSVVLVLVGALYCMYECWH